MPFSDRQLQTVQEKHQIKQLTLTWNARWYIECSCGWCIANRENVEAAGTAFDAHLPEDLRSKD